MTKRSLIFIGLLLFATCVFAISLITVTAPISTAQVGVLYNSSVTASGGNPPYTYSVTSGSLPGGLTLNGNSGAITGVPNQVGTFTFTITATDSPFESGTSPAARSRAVSQSAPPAASGGGSFSISVAAGAVASGAPISPFALLLAGLGLALAGIYQMRRMQQSV
jgi:hypothetical protein